MDSGTGSRRIRADAIYRRAAALIERFRDFEALECLREAVDLLPKAEGRVQLAALELQFTHPQEALRQIDLALAVRPDDLGALVVKARVLAVLGRSEEADLAWHAAQSRVPDPRSIARTRANNLLELGRFDEAIVAFRALVETDPLDVKAISALVAAKRITDSDSGLVDRLRQLAGVPGLPAEYRIALHYALGKCLDNLDEYEEAMNNFDAANRLEFERGQVQRGFNRGAFSNELNCRKSIFTRERLDELRTHGDPTELPVFVLGIIRSGTTLVEQILSSHPLVRGAGEQRHWVNADPMLFNFAAGELNVAELRPQAAVYRRLLAEFALGVTRVVDKQPGNLILAGLLSAAFPNARVVCVRRNLADTAISIWTTRMRTSAPFAYHKGNIAFALPRYFDLLDHWRSVVSEGRWLDLDYESLVLDRESAVRRLIEFCGLPWDPKCSSPEANRGLITTPSLWQARQPVYETSIGRWKGYEPWLGPFQELVS